MSPRRWLIPLAALAIAIAPALASTAASASTHSSRALAIRTGGTAQHVIKPGTVALGAHSGLRNETSSTNWSGYAADSGTYTSVSASWVSPPAPARRGPASTPASGLASTDTAATASSKTARTPTA